MNYLAEILAFNNWIEFNSNINKSDICLWHALMHMANRFGWQEFNASISVLILKSKLNKDAIYRARNKLKQLDLIEFKERSGNQSAVYMLNSVAKRYGQNATQNTTENATQSAIQNATQTATQSATILKTRNQKLKTKNKESNLSTPLRYVEKLPKKFASKNRLENEFENILSESDHDEFENTLPNSAYGEHENAQLTNEEFKNTQFANGKFERLGNSKDESKNAQFSDKESAISERHKNNEFKNAQLASGEFEKPEKHKHDESKNTLSKSTYGEFKNVFLTSEEFAKLETEYGKELNEIIEHLSSYIEMKGYKAKSHYLAIRKWVALAYREQKLHEAELAKREENLKQRKNFDSGGNNDRDSEVARNNFNSRGNNSQNSESTRNNFNNRANNSRDSEVARRAYCTEFAHIKSTDGSTYTDEQMAEVRAETARMLKEEDERLNKHR